MTILILNWRDPKNPASGGAEIALFEHAKYWIKNGAKVIWFASNFKNAPGDDEIDEIIIIRKGSHFTTHFWAFVYYMRNKFGKPDLIIDCFHFLPFFTPLYAKAQKKIALINEPAKNAWFNNVFFPLNIIGFLIEPFFFIPYRNIPFITGSKSVADELISYNLDKKRIKIIYHGFYPPKKNPQTGEYKKEKNPTLIYLAQIATDKGIEDAIKTFKIIHRQIPRALFWIVGKAITEDYLTNIKKVVSQEKLDNAVTFFGFVEEDKKNELLSRAWILIHPSIREGWGLNVIEANAAGTPAVGYNVVGLKDSIKNNQTGLLVEKKTEALAKAINKLITDKKLYQNMSNEGKKWAKNFNWEKSAKKSWGLITNVLK